MSWGKFASGAQLGANRPKLCNPRFIGYVFVVYLHLPQTVVCAHRRGTSALTADEHLTRSQTSV
jgi:hypothetical protein